MEKEPNLESLIRDFNNITKLNVPRLMILNLQLYVEHYVNELVSFEIGENAREEVKTYLSFPQKLRVLKKMKMIDEQQLKILELLNKIRDNLVHELVLDFDKIKKRLKSSKLDFNYGWSYKKENKRIGKIVDLKKEYKKMNNKFQQLSISVLLIIGILYNKLKIMKKERVNQFIDITFKKEAEKTNVEIKVVKI